MKMRQLRTAALWTVVCVITGAVAMSMAPSTQARPVFSTTHPDPSQRAMVARGPVKTKAVLTTHNKDGSVAHRYVYGPKTMGKTLKLPRTLRSGGGSSNQDPITFSVKQTQPSSIFHNDLWWAKIWTDWYWDIVGLDHYVHVYSAGKSEYRNGAWSFDGIIAHHKGHYQWCCGVNNSGFKHMVQFAFSGPALGVTNAHCYPKLDIYSHSDGSWWWDASNGC